MSTESCFINILAIVILASTLSAVTQQPDAEFRNSEQVNAMPQHDNVIRPPDLTEEERGSNGVPENFKCDACLIISLRIDETLTAYHRKNRHLNTLPESELFDAFEKACSHRSFEQVGIREDDGEKSLSAPGMPNFLAPGILMGGDGWAGRVTSMCGAYIEEFEEWAIYEEWFRNGIDALDKFLCYSKKHKKLTDHCITQHQNKQRKEEL